MRCQKPVCLKEINPKYHPGVFLGKPFEFEDHWLACHLCMMSDISPEPIERLIGLKDIGSIRTGGN